MENNEEEVYIISSFDHYDESLENKMDELV